MTLTSQTPGAPVRDSTLSPSDEPLGARVAGRVGQFLLGVPLGVFQLGAVLWFSFAGPMTGARDWLVAGWGVLMSASCALLALRVWHSARARRIAFVLLGVQTLFSLVKLLVYHESAALVFGTITVAAAAALAVHHRAQAGAA